MYRKGLYKDNVLISKDGDRVTGFIIYGKCEDEGFEECGCFKAQRIQ